MQIAYLDGPRLRRALIAGCEYVQRQRAELNRINVYPVPDGDTGTNLALTVSSIADRLRTSREASVGVVAEQAAEAGILGARGNCGMILSHYLLGFSKSVGQRPRLSPGELPGTLRGAADHVYRALERPVEGTILTVMRETAEAAESAHSTDFVVLVEQLLERARVALARTPELLPQLRKAGVVDAGAKGFVHLLEGIVAVVHGDPFIALEELPVYDDVVPAAARMALPTETERYRFCTEALVRGAGLPDASTIKDALRERGDSLIVIRSGEVLKVHVHTDEPERVFAYLRSLGPLVSHKAEDMRAQHAAVQRAAAAHVQLARRPVSIVSDSACDLPDEIVRAHGIQLVPLALIYGDQVLRDRIDIDTATFVQRLRRGERATTSQPPPAAFLEGYARAAQDGETVLAVLLGSTLSGTFASADAAARAAPELSLRLVDSRATSLLQGLLVLKAAELGELGRAPADIAAELERVRAQSGLLFTVDVFEHLLASGRVGRGRAWLGSVLDIKPILGLNAKGVVEPLAKVRGRAKVLPKVLELLAARIPARPQGLRFGVIHVGAEEIAQEVAAALRSRWGERETLITPASPVVATHIGPGAWGVAYLLED